MNYSVVIPASNEMPSFPCRNDSETGLKQPMTLRIEFKPQDCWIGVFWKKTVEGRPYYRRDEFWRHRWDVWVCFVPMFPLHLQWRSGHGQMGGRSGANGAA